MFTILWILILASLISYTVHWLLANNGEVVINWFNYQIISDALTVFALTIILVILIFIFSYILARILSFKFPNMFKIFFKKSYVRRLETIIKRQNKAFDEIAKTLTYIDLDEIKNAKKSQKKLHSMTKNKNINEYLSAKIDFAKGDSSLVKFAKKIKSSKLFNLFNR